MSLDDRVSRLFESREKLHYLDVSDFIRNLTCEDAAEIKVFDELLTESTNRLLRVRKAALEVESLLESNVSIERFAFFCGKLCETIIDATYDIDDDKSTK
ncbi:hypothetical protein [Dyadobacter sp. CY323]|uniref:hypothetical protein n=1 Tax=Dyadobacter sp. CY323 TaxID=2907302 RepID=UPI001F278886|nr:hypothetical protein [Dyadobacter sp. CY323]MCE6992085.1 hypothetical protein [Dyadobacter sp. CY323]